MVTITDILKSLYVDLMQGAFLKNRSVQIIILTMVLALFSGGVYFGYMSYRSYKNGEAQKILSVCLEEYVQAIHGSDELWSTLEMNCQLGYDQYKSSDFAPYFLAIKIEALLHQGKKDEVWPLLNNMLQSFSSSSALYSLYQTQKALIELDAADEDTVNKGLKALAALAEDVQNKNRDYALYYLGLYYWHQNRIDDARNAWQELIQNFSMSPWAKPVSVKLLQVTE